MKKYPTTKLNQHKALATGAPLAKCNKADKDPSGWGPGGMGKGGTVSSSGTTGSGRGRGVPKSTFTPA